MTGPEQLPTLPDLVLPRLLDEARQLQPDTVALRRRLHAHPEIGLQLPNTQQQILDALDGLPLEITTGKTSTSVTAVLRGAEPGPSVLLRADMDALPLQEESGLDFPSEVDGVMHACGHDTHVAMLVSAARLLSRHVDELAGSVVFMFQPGEEGQHGARHMIHEGVLDAAGQRVERAFGVHIYPTLPSGQVYTRPGPLMAAVDDFHVRVLGKGGHGSMPAAAIDPIPAAAALVGALHTMSSRRFAATEPAVLSVTHLEAGTTTNIIPETAFVEGTMRTLSDSARATMRAEVEKVCEGIAAAYGCRVQVDLTPGYPVTANDPDEAARVLDLASAVLGPDNAIALPDPIMGGEDFSYVLQRVPGAFALLGGCPPDVDPAEAPANHSNRVNHHEDAMTHGVAMHAAYALSALR
ncbi:M20 family metallopeptidase [Prauserella halophila]|uniref:M20 family metallopeptidase n=1 Tax=Prauserella halophila TaxID=185641 RepID=A0ABP4GXG5_9PSEU|nr:M20 family metallopeptidase [Prauserella halophila]MCP2237061.1 hippurate hydrolase [Prauserella halophila]